MSKHFYIEKAIHFLNKCKYNIQLALSKYFLNDFFYNSIEDKEIGDGDLNNSPELNSILKDLVKEIELIESKLGFSQIK